MTQRKWLPECHAWLDDPTSVQYKDSANGWETPMLRGASPVAHPHLTWRIKPSTITINGTELPKPMENGNTNYEIAIACLGDGDAPFKEFSWHTREYRDEVYAKLVEVLGS